MTIEILPVGQSCNIKCSYCYEEPMRDAGNISPIHNFNAVLKAAIDNNYKFSLFGGEPLLLSLDKLETLLRLGFVLYGNNNIQTNGTLMTQEHINLFKKYHCQVGISTDGPMILNYARKGDDGRSNFAIEELLKAGIIPSIIVTLHKNNATGENLGTLINWFKTLEAKGLKHISIHHLEKHGDDLSLTLNEAIHAFDVLLQFQLTSKLRFDKFQEIAKLLIGNREVNCEWRGCDPYTTPAVHGINADGSLTNCGRTFKDGVTWLKGEYSGKERQLALYHTPQDQGGCQGCDYFAFCQGECPGQSADFRSKTDHCDLLKFLFSTMEAHLHRNNIKTLSVEERRKLEAELLKPEERNIKHGDTHTDTPHEDIWYIPAYKSGLSNAGVP